MKKQSRQIIFILFTAILFFTNNCFVFGKTQNPILILAGDKSYAPYTGEILKTEGFNEFQIQSFNDAKVSLKWLKKFDVIILTDMNLSDQQAGMLTNYVQSGGNLIAFKPNKKLNALLGIEYAGGATDAAYILIKTNTHIGNGITSQALQLHVNADKYLLKGGKIIASFYKDAFTSTEYPAVVTHDYGKGHTISFLYNLPQNISYTRQGNFRNAGVEMDGITGIRAMDLFTNGWVDTSKNTINQADEQMRLLSHAIEKMSEYKKPLPRFWYFPDTLKCLVTLNNDGEDSKEAGFQKQFEDVDAKGGKMTLYVKEVDFISKKWIQTWVNKGFEMSGHPDNTKQATNPDWNTMDSVFKNLNVKLKATYNIGPMRTVTNHWFVWCGKNKNGDTDFSAQVQIEEQNGILLDCNYAHYDNGSNQGHFLGSFGINHGNYTGSGLTMKFANMQGDVINVYQHFNNVYDQQYMEHDDKDGFYNCFKGLVDRSLDDEVYSFVSVKAHNAEYFFSEKPLMKMLDYANSKNIPVWTEEKLLDFLLAKDDAAFSDIIWKHNTLSFKIKSALTHTSGITYMLPFIYNGKKISNIKSNGVIQVFSPVSLKGTTYAWVTIKPGADYNIVASYSEK
ncbi:MAG: hypothetical protein ABIU77_01755 [Ferruginibacter sp.]